MFSRHIYLVLWLATTATFKNIATCPRFKGHCRVHAEVNGARGYKGENRYGNGDGNGESGPAGTERRRERQIGEAGASGGGRGKLENVSRVCVSVPEFLQVGRCRLDLAPITFVTGVTAD